MHSIVYDLETTDTEPIGQIINYSFIAVDRNWKIISELSDNIKISRLQLPRIGAILANRTDVLEHQKTTSLTEKEAMLRIHAFLKKEIERAHGGFVPFIGYNSSRFDLPYLRTSLIRNGINPYFGGKLINRDLLLASRKLSCTHTDFPRSPDHNGERDRMSLKLENLCKRLNLLEGKQTHNSRDDVLLTIKYAKTILDRFNLDVRTYEPYEPAKLTKKGAVAVQIIPEYDLNSENPFISIPVALLDNNHRYALWVDLNQYREHPDRNSVRLHKKMGGSFFHSSSDLSKENRDLAVQAVKKLGDLNLNNYFSTSTCDIEQDIYRLDFNAIGALEKALYRHNRSELDGLESRDAKVIFLRNQLAEYHWGSGQDDRIKNMLRQYALYRYGGKAKMNKFSPVPRKGQASEGERYHINFSEMMEEVNQACQKGTKKDQKLAKSLKEYYLKSDLIKAAGPDLEPTIGAQTTAA